MNREQAFAAFYRGEKVEYKNPSNGEWFDILPLTCVSVFYDVDEFRIKHRRCQVSNWISVDDRLPEIIHEDRTSQALLVVHSVDPSIKPVVGIGYLSSSTWKGLSGLELYGVTHWMEIPNPPEE